jgi:phage N-6-adenine-methyltransferase
MKSTDSGWVTKDYPERRTLGASDNRALLGGMRAKNNGRYNGNGREWETPPELFKKLDDEFHFNLDPCATSANHKCFSFFTEADNGLTIPWVEMMAPLEVRAFMNPPYGREVAAWTHKAREEADKGALVVGLLPASTDLAWWHEDVWRHAEIRYIRGRVRFLTGGPYRASGFFASVIVIWRPRLRNLDRYGWEWANEHP